MSSRCYCTHAHSTFSSSRNLIGWYSVDNQSDLLNAFFLLFQDYAKNTMNSFLSMYGYEESMTTEALKSKIKSEPNSPSKETKHSYTADGMHVLLSNITIL